MNVVHLRTCLPALLALAALPAAELPLGIVEQVDAQGALVRFDAAAKPAAGQMVALYGPGALVKHPLTKKVITENRKLLAKAQVVGPEGERLRLRVLWRSEGATPETGWDAVPLPGEAAPNGPPALTAEAKPVSAAAGATVRVALPIVDPDGDRLIFTWTLEGAAGRVGLLDAPATTVPEVLWTAPGVQPEGGIRLLVSARDPLGQECSTTLALTSTPTDDPAKRSYRTAGAFGANQEPAFQALERDPDGGFVALDAEGGRIWRIAPGWLGLQAAAFSGDDAPRRPVAVAVSRHELHVLDTSRPAVLVYGPDNALRRTLSGGLSSAASDLVVAADGTVYVADNEAGGVLVFDPQGRFRARAGRKGGEDGFAELTRLCLGADGELCCLDPKARRILRFDAGLRRLDAWTVVGDPKTPPVDLCTHPRGVAVLFADGQVQIYTGKGTAGETWKSASESGLAENLRDASALAVDAAGEAMVVWRDARILARHALNGACTGVRGPQLRKSLVHWAADGLGRQFALDEDYALMVAHDGAGFRIGRSGGKVKAGGPFSGPGALAAAPDGSAVAVIDTDKRTVVRLDARDAKQAPQVFAGRGENPGQFEDPVAIAIDEAGRIYVLDQDLYRVSVFDAKGQFLFAFGAKGKGPDQLYEPKLLAVAPDGSAAYVLDEYRYELKKFVLDQSGKAGKHAGNGGGKGSEAGQFRGPAAMGCDRQGLVHVLDTSRGDWQIIDFRGQAAAVVAGRKTEECGLRGAEGLAVAPDGQVFLAGGGAVVGLRW